MIRQHNKELSAESKPPIVSRIKDRVRWFLEHARIKISYDDFMMIVTLFVLFGDDLRLLSFPPSADTAFAALNNICFFLFLIELILNCWAKSEFIRTKSIWRPKVKGYMFSFFFWLDLLAVVSMVPDILWLSSLLGLGALPGAGSVGTKVGKAGRIGAKTSRVVRMVRLVRLVKLYKITSQRRRERKMIEDLRRLVALGHIDHSEVSQYLERMNAQKQSKVGAELSDIITRRVIIAVLIMLCVVPMLSWSPTVQDELEATMFLHAVNVEAGAGTGSTGNATANCEYLTGSVDAFKQFMDSIIETTKLKDQYLLGLSIEPQRCNSSLALDFDDYPLIQEFVRKDSISVIETPSTTVDGVEYSITAIFNLSSFVEDQARAGIYLTIFVIFMLVTMSAQFTGDAQKLVLAPIENMMEMVNLVAEDPLEEFDFSHHTSQSNGAGGGQYETRVVQIAIQKITALLRVGFGVAGADIISTNMAIGEGESSAVLEPMIPGKRVYAIFGFTDIHAFDYCTEKLEDEIMTFVNSVARIVHDEVTRWGGLCNKNLGNAFLMVWRIGDEDELQAVSGRKRRASHSSSRVGGISAVAGGTGGRTMSPTATLRRGSGAATPVMSPGGPTSPSSARQPMSTTSNIRGLSVDLRRIPGLDIMSDKALIGFLKVVVEINRDKQVLAYRADNRLTVDGSQEYKLRMGFGLHAGWAIEGAVGSLQKVDATYLSPHVNMAARMEAASRQFKVSILMTERFVELMSPEAQEHCRKIDVVTVKGSATPMPVYTYDTYQNQTFPELQAPKFSSLNLEEVLAAQADEYDVHTWNQDEDLLQLRRLSTPEFNVTFRDGLTAYLTGQWDKARQLLERADEMMCQSELGGDGPSQTILNYMKHRDWICPPDWAGYRPLTCK